MQVCEYAIKVLKFKLVFHLQNKIETSASFLNKYLFCMCNVTKNGKVFIK